jgi:hypothetical protein
LLGSPNNGIAIVRLDNNGVVKWANTYGIGPGDLEVEPHETSDGAIFINVHQRNALIKIGPDGKVNWTITTAKEITLGLPDFQFGSTAYRFIQPYLFASGMRFASGKLTCAIFAINYQTGQIEKQVSCNFPGAIGFTELTNDSLYVTLLDQIMTRKSKSLAALLRFDFDLNLRAAKNIQNAEPHWPISHMLPSGKSIFSYSYHDQKALVVGTTDANFESPGSCGVLQRANYTVTKSNFSVHSANVPMAPLPSIAVSDAKGQTSQADLKLEHFDLTASPCR